MVSFNTILVIGALIVGFVVLVGSGGPSGLGKKIGGGIGSGFQQFSSSLASAFTGGLFGGSANPNTGGINDTGQIGPPPRTGTEDFDPFGNLLGSFKGVQNLLDSLNNAVANIFSSTGTPLVIGGQSFATAKDPQIVQLGPKSKGTQFGGFINAATQSAALNAAIAESKAKFPEFF